MRRRVIRRVLLYSLGAIAIAGAVIPFLNADRAKPRIAAALETALGRPVSLGAVHYAVFTGPGFSVDDVLIGEEQGGGIEPFAHVGTLRARLRLSSLWTGRLVFSSLSMEDASINFVKTAGGPWNFQQLMARLAETQSQARIPELEINSGRLDFKMGDTKSVFYVRDADVDVYPDSRGALVVRFSGEPARTDGPAQGLGRVVARGTLRQRAGDDEELQMGVQLERTALPELVHLFGGRDLGVRGYAASNMELSGPLSNINITGTLRIDDIHRWDLMPNPGEGWTLRYEGNLDLRSHNLRLAAVSPDREKSPITGEFEAADYLSAPRWTAALRFASLPAASLVGTATHLGAPFPEGMTVSGTVDGAIGYSSPEGVHGDLTIGNGSLKFPQGGVVQFASAPIKVTNTSIDFGPTSAQLSADQAADVEAHYLLDKRALKLRLSSDSLTLGALKLDAARLAGGHPMPLLDRCHGGSWHGWLSLDRTDDEPDVWTGEYDLENTQLDIPGMASPVRLSASVSMQPAQIQINRMHGRAGTIAFEGDYRWALKEGAPDRIRLSTGPLDLSEVEQQFLPALERQNRFLSRAFPFRKAPAPDWLRTRQIEGTVQASAISLGAVALGAAKAHIAWNGAAVRFLNVETRLNEARGSGRIAINLGTASPQYQLTGQVEGLDYHRGLLNLDGSLTTNGTGAALVGNAQSSGSFDGADIQLAPGTEVDGISGEFRLESGGAAPKVVLSNVQVTQGDDTFTGTGTGQADGHLVLELTSGSKRVRMTGMLLPVRPEPAIARQPGRP